MRSNLFCDMFIQHWKNKKNRFAAGEVRPGRDSRRGFEWKRENWETQISKLLVSATAPGPSAGQAGGFSRGRRGGRGVSLRVILFSRRTGIRFRHRPRFASAGSRL